MQLGLGVGTDILYATSFLIWVPSNDGYDVTGIQTSPDDGESAFPNQVLLLKAWSI